MAVAVSPSTISAGTKAPANAATTTATGAGIAMAMTAPLVLMLLGPVSKMLFTRGGEHAGDWLHVLMVIMIPLAPAMYALFMTSTFEMLKSRVGPAVRGAVMRVAAVGILPYIVVAGAGYATDNFTLKMIGAITVPLAMAATIAAAAKQ